jgi:hypothetical protein
VARAVRPEVVVVVATVVVAATVVVPATVVVAAEVAVVMAAEVAAVVMPRGYRGGHRGGVSFREGAEQHCAGDRGCTDCARGEATG